MSFKIFISRKLEEESLFLRLKHSGIDLIDQSMIRFESVDFDFDTGTDWLFFYSANGVKSFCEKIKDLPPGIKSAAIGEKTGFWVKQYFGKADFCGSGSGEDSCQDFKSVLDKGQKVTVVRAAHSDNVLFRYLRDNEVDVREIIVYKNIPIDPVPVIDAQIYIFTSSMNARIFMSGNIVPDGAVVVSIGAPTTRVLEELGLQNVVTAISPGEEELYRICADILANR